jgi:hypothetical protein
MHGAILPLVLQVWAAVSGTTTIHDAKRPPWVKGSPTPASARIVATAVRVAPPPAGVPEGWIPLEALQGVAGDLTRRLDARDDLKVVALPIAEEGRPAVRLGCAGDDETGDELGEECDPEQRGMRLAITQGSKRWRAALPLALTGAEADHLLLIDVAVRDHWVGQKGLSFKKEVPLGAGHSQPAPWLTSLDTPVCVLQLEGVLVGPDGKLVRSAVEGIYATRTRFGESVIGLQRVLTDEDVAKIRTSLRREDLPGTPLVWEAALDALVRELVRRGD